ncbi:efflux RND transporter permease subunit [Lyngbya confervoides]|uniref:Efflux RND transporter permease subunit n=1 Tax=Lyngbya confervoides BDU141951 TaxID=1574623 RepID=A0ABD4T5H6_9CYAN|nr:efflux RND transporter permease subunit [Lyngbya confervoides]MCM1983943.1 efflux RND transporter permease subunit [Lyngbya confervoides BDU141951]
MSSQGFSLSGLSIRRHIGTLMLTIAVFVIGLFIISSLQVDLLPTITYPRIGVRVNAPGISPEVAVDEITRPLEEALSATEGVTQVYSQTREGRISLDLFFRPGGDIDQALNEATAALNRARGSLPDTVESPRLFKFDPSQLPIYELALTSPTLPGSELRAFAEDQLARELRVIPGVSSVDVSGSAAEEVRVIVDFNRLQALGVGLTDVLNALRERNQDISGGRIQGEISEPLTRTLGRFQSAQDLRDLPLPSGEATDLPENSLPLSGLSPRRLYLRDVAQVIDGTEQERVFVSLNQQTAVKVSIQKQPDANTIAVVDEIQQRLAELREAGIIPADAVLTSTLDESKFIRNSIATVLGSGLSGAVLAAIAVLLFLGSLRQTLIIVLAIPLATLAAVILMGLFGLSINVFSLGGLALGVGIVVDNSIVMLENIAQGSGMTPGQDAVAQIRPLQFLRQSAQSAREVESALVAATSTNLVAVLPFLLLGGFFALLFRELILTVSFAIAASILIAITVVPMATSRLLAIPKVSGLNQFWLLVQFNRRFLAATNRYRQALAWVLQRRLSVILAVILVLGGSGWWMAGQLPQEILPRINTGQARLIARFPAGTPLESNLRVMAQVDEILMNQPETDDVFSTAGGFLFGTSTSENPLRGSSTITLKPGTDVDAYIERVSQEFDQLNLVDVLLRLSPGEVRGLITNNSPVRGAEVDIGLQGEDPVALAAAGEQVLQVLEEQVSAARFRPDADESESEFQIRPDWDRAAAVNLTAQEIGATIQTAIEGSVPTQLQRGNRLIDVRVELDEAAISSPSQLNQLPLFVGNGRAVRLGDVASIEEGQAPSEVQRINQQQVFLMAGNLNEGASLSQAFAEVEQALAQVELPPGISLLPSSAAETNRQLQSALQILGGLAIFLVFVVMAVQYNSLVDPLVILFTIPLAMTGGILGLYVTQTAVGATVVVGAVLLVGIVVNNAIIMIELANQIREREGIDRQAAILKAAPQRLRPILMTTITTVLGMFPLALGIGEGSEFLQPLGIVVFSGLSLATALTLFVIPCFYLLLHGGPGNGKESLTAESPFIAEEEEAAPSQALPR